jgi:hypothetical protein
MHGFTESRAPMIRAADLGGRDTIYRGLTTERLNPDDQSLLQSAISLTVGVLLVMLERPQMVAHGSFTGKRAKSGAEFWAPNIIGKRYRVESDLSHHGVSPRMHWRRGHWRAQPYGERHLLRKLIWIEPTVVAGQSADEQSTLSAQPLPTLAHGGRAESPEAARHVSPLVSPRGVNCPTCFALPHCRGSPKGFGQHYRKLGQNHRLVGRPGPRQVVTQW